MKLADKKKRNIKLNTDRLEEIDSLTTGRTYGIDHDLLKQADEDRLKITDTIKKINNRNSHLVSSGMIEFFTSMIYEDDFNKNKNKNIMNEIKRDKTFEKMLSETNITELSNLFNSEKERIDLYTEYEAVINYIPQVYQALDAMADAVLSPDDYSKKVLDITYNGEENSSINDHNKIINNVNRLEDKYNIEDRLKKIIFKSLYLGDSFILVNSLKEEFDQLLTEDTNNFIKNESVILNESNLILSEEELSAFKELFIESKEEKNKDKSNKTLVSDDKIRDQLLDMLNNNIEYSTNSNSLIEKELKMANEFKSKYDTEAFIKKTLKDNTDTNSSKMFTNVDENEKKRYSSLNMNITGNEKYSKKKFKDIDIKGSYVKELDPTKVFKLNMGSTCFGYFYIETDLPERKNQAHMVSTQITDFRLRTSADITTSNVDDELNNPKIKLITDVFGRALSNKVDKKFIEDNREFKLVMYELLKKDYITKKRVRIVYLEPDSVFHFAPEFDDDGYGISKLSKILFTCKLYIATLITNLMMKLSRSIDHRAFYIETGLSKDIEATVQSFIRNIKSKEVRLNDLQTIDTIFKSIGQLIIVDFKIF